mmetsp:Transcript_104070/g.333647  ORF Transcript_104070/g.333647 Transcript_104070/m.333647 type:complete len:230 (+) Transcript_104070:744-1433(+)
MVDRQLVATPVVGPGSVHPKGKILPRVSGRRGHQTHQRHQNDCEKDAAQIQAHLLDDKRLCLSFHELLHGQGHHCRAYGRACDQNHAEVAGMARMGGLAHVLHDGEGEGCACEDDQREPLHPEEEPAQEVAAQDRDDRRVDLAQADDQGRRCAQGVGDAHHALRQGLQQSAQRELRYLLVIPSSDQALRPLALQRHRAREKHADDGAHHGDGLGHDVAIRLHDHGQDAP